MRGGTIEFIIWKNGTFNAPEDYNYQDICNNDNIIYSGQKTGREDYKLKHGYGVCIESQKNREYIYRGVVKYDKELTSRDTLGKKYSMKLYKNVTLNGKQYGDIIRPTGNEVDHYFRWKKGACILLGLDPTAATFGITKLAIPKKFHFLNINSNTLKKTICKNKNSKSFSIKKKSPPL